MTQQAFILGVIGIAIGVAAGYLIVGKININN
jgi:hypothetical protein